MGKLSGIEKTTLSNKWNLIYDLSNFYLIYDQYLTGRMWLLGEAYFTKKWLHFTNKLYTNKKIKNTL